MRGPLFSLLVLVLPALILAGCGKPPSADPRYVEPTAGFADFVRRDVAGLKGGEGGVAATLDEFLENMEGYEKKPLGEHKDTYDAIMKAAGDLKRLKDGKAGRAELLKKIDEMIGLTRKLPSAAKR